MHGCYLSLARSEFLAALLERSQPGLRLDDGGFSLLLDEELRRLLLLSQYFNQGGELDTDPGRSLLKSHLLMERAESFLKSALRSTCHNYPLQTFFKSTILSFTCTSLN